MQLIVILKRIVNAIRGCLGRADAASLVPASARGGTATSLGGTPREGTARVANKSGRNSRKSMLPSLDFAMLDTPSSQKKWLETVFRVLTNFKTASAITSFFMTPAMYLDLTGSLFHLTEGERLLIPNKDLPTDILDPIPHLSSSKTYTSTFMHTYVP